MHEGAEAQLRQVILTKPTPHGGENTGYLKLSCILRQNTYQNLELPRTPAVFRFGTFNHEDQGRGWFSAPGGLRINPWGAGLALYDRAWLV